MVHETVELLARYGANILEAMQVCFLQHFGHLGSINRMSLQEPSCRLPSVVLVGLAVAATTHPDIECM